MAQVALYMFGPPRIEIDREPATIDTRKALALFVYPTTRRAITLGMDRPRRRNGNRKMAE